MQLPPLPKLPQFSQLSQLPKQKLFLIIGLILASLAILMTKAYIDQQRQEIVMQAQAELAKKEVSQTEVFVAKQDIPSGTAIDAALLGKASVPEKYVQPQAVTSLERIAGMITTAPISKGEQVTLTKLSFTAPVTKGELAQATPVGKRAITIAVDNIAALAGMLKVGDYVDVIALLPIPVPGAPGKKPTQQLITMPLFQNVLILAIGQETAVQAAAQAAAPKPKSRYEKGGEASSAGSSGPLVITLALSPQEANLIAFVQEQARLRLTLRAPTDSKIEPAQPASWDTIYQYLAPKEAPADKKKEMEQQQATDFVEIFRGQNKERVPLGK